MFNTAEVMSKESYSKQIGSAYLYGRIFEFVPKSLAILIYLSLYKDVDAESCNKHFNALMASGLIVGQIGNALQAYQGVLDRRLIVNYPELYIDTDKYRFAIVAMVRGSVNVLADSTACVALFNSASELNIASTLLGMMTDVLGLYKNVRDTRQSIGLSKLAFGLCAMARLPLLLGALLIALNRSSEEDKGSVIGYSVLLVGMILFVMGASVRQVNYHFSSMFSRGRTAAIVAPAELEMVKNPTEESKEGFEFQP